MRPLYIFDLDGTLALIDHRRHLVSNVCARCDGGGKESPASAGVVLLSEGETVPDRPLPSCYSCGGSGQRKPDWPAFFAACVDDEPNYPVIRTLHNLLLAHCDVQIWSGRSAAVMNETLAWLHRFVFWHPKIDPDEVQLVMRRDGDFTPDQELKAAWLDALHPKDRSRLVGVFDDRDKVVAMWRSKGVACFQVAPGEF